MGWTTNGLIEIVKLCEVYLNSCVKMTSLPVTFSSQTSDVTNSNTQQANSNMNILVGDDQCSYVKVCNVLRGCNSQNLWPQLFDVGRSLGVPAELIFSIKRSLNLEITTHNSALNDILESWRSHKADAATLMNLIAVLDCHELYECGDALRACFKVTNRQLETIPHVSKEALNFKVSFQGSDMQLHEILQCLPNHCVQKLAERFLRQPPRLKLRITDSLPVKLLHYVPRRLSTRCKLDPALFDFECADVFVFRHIELHKLAVYAKNHGTDLSTNQLDSLSVRFILLEYAQDFDKICEISNSPVHLIDHENGQFSWLKSCGNILNLKKHVHTSQCSLDEEELTRDCMKSRNIICVSDTPGMGKTVLLCSIARKILHAQPHTVVRYIVLRDFIQKVKNISDATNPEFLINLIADEACETKFGFEIIKELFQVRCQTVHLMFDGYDEVLESQVEITNLVLKTVSHLKSVKLYVTTRPHLRNELENTLSVLGYTIQAFDTTDQQVFLTKFWRQLGTPTIDSKLLEFAKKCIEKLQETMNDFERGTAGIPLQCLLLAEVYQDEAVKYANPESNMTGKDNEIKIRTTSFFEMYRQLIELRFKKVEMASNIGLWRKLTGSSPKDRKEFFTKAHEYAALALLFPDYVRQFKHYLIEPKQFKTRELCAIGILESADISNGPVRFVHRTFAEYYIGMFVARMMTSHSDFGYPKFTRKVSFIDFLLNTILRTTMSRKVIFHTAKWRQPTLLETSSFYYPVICYFVNGHIRTTQYQTVAKQPWTTDPDKFFNVASACVNHDYHSLSKLVLQPVTQREFQQYGHRVVQLVFLAAKHTNVDHFKTIYNYGVESLVNVTPKALVLEFSSSSEFLVTPLHIAAERGNFAIFNFLLNFGLAHPKSLSTKYVVHCCVAGSKNNDKITLSQKPDIIILLSKTNPETINEKLTDSATPLLTFNVHVELIKTLLNCGADLHATTSSSENVLHICAKHGNHAALSYLLKLPLVSNALVIAEDSSAYTPFLHGLMFGDGLTLEIIKMMEEKGLVITSKLATDALMVLLCNRNILPSDLTANFVQTVDYLNSKGGILQVETESCPWLIESIKWNQSRLANATTCDEMFLSELLKRDVLTEGDKVVYLGHSEKLYDFLLKSTKEKSFEAVCVSLIACNQLKPFILLKQYLKNDAQEMQLMFVTLPNGLANFIESNHTGVVVLRSFNVEVSALRLQNTIDPHIPIITEEALEKSLPVSKLMVCKCNIATKLLVEKLAARQVKIICLCNDAHQNIECVILNEDIHWTDLSRKFQNELFCKVQIKVAKNYTFSNREYSSSVCRIRENRWGFLNISEITKNPSDFKNEILIDFIQGYQPELAKFCLTQGKSASSCLEGTKKCTNFNICDCGISTNNLKLELYLRPYNTDKTFIYYCPATAIRDLLQEDWAHNPFAVEIFEVTKLQETTASWWASGTGLTFEGDETTKISGFQQIISIVHKCVQRLNFNESHWRKLTEVAINTVLPGRMKRRGISEMEVFSAIGLLEECNGSFSITCKTLAWYLVAKLVLIENNWNFEFVNVARREVFMVCLKNYTFMPPFIELECVMFQHEKLVNIIEFLLNKQRNGKTLKNYLEKNMIKELPCFIYACIFGDLVRLLEVIMSVGVSSKFYHDKMLVLFAVQLGSTAIVKLVIDKFVTETGTRVQDINFTDEDFNTYTGPIKWKCSRILNIDLTKIALLRGDKVVIKMVEQN